MGGEALRGKGGGEGGDRLAETDIQFSESCAFQYSINSQGDGIQQPFKGF